MRYSICNELFEGWELADVCATVRQLGYTGLEIAPFTLSGQPDQLSAAERRDVRRKAEDAGLQVAGLHWLLARTEGFHLTSPDPAVRDATAAYLCSLVDLCADLGGAVLVFGSPMQRNVLPGVNPEDAWSFAVEGLSRVGQACEARDVTFCIEPLGPEETNFINTAEDAWRLAQETGSPNVKIILDVKAMSTESVPIQQTIRWHCSHAGHFHANDPNRRGPGFGDVDFVPIMQALAEEAYAGWVSVEVFDFRPDPVTIARQSLEYMERCVQEADNQR